MYIIKLLHIARYGACGVVELLRIQSDGKQKQGYIDPCIIVHVGDGFDIFMGTEIQWQAYIMLHITLQMSHIGGLLL